jgi:hypothetical protein
MLIADLPGEGGGKKGEGDSEGSIFGLEDHYFEGIVSGIFMRRGNCGQCCARCIPTHVHKYFSSTTTTCMLRPVGDNCSVN